MTHKKPARILIVEDEGILAKHISSDLINLGYEVIGITASGESAVELAQSLGPDLVLMDIKLKGKMDGITAAEHIQELLGIPIVYLTAFSDTDSLERAKITNPFGYVIKPVATRELRAAIEIALYRHTLETLLKESEARNRAILSAIPDQMFVLDRYGTFIDYHAANADNLFVPPEEFLGKNIEDIFQKDLAAIFLEMLEKTIATKQIQMHQYQLPIAKNLRHFEMRLVPYSNSGALAIVRDVTEQIQAQKDSELSSTKYKALFNGINDAVFVYPLQKEGSEPFIEVNETACNRLGYTRQELLKLSFKDISAPEDAQPRGSQEVRKKLLNDSWTTFEAKHITKTGKIIPVEVSSRIFPYEGKSAIMSIAKDITERKRVQEMMIVNEKMLSVGRLAVGIAHELNNPLAGMMQTANVMHNRLSQDDLPANLKAAEEAGTSMQSIRAFMESRGIPRMLAAIHKSGQRLASTIANMLNFSQRRESQVLPHNVPDLLDKALELAASAYDLEKRYAFKSIEIIKEYQDDLPIILCEGANIQQVFLNILNNGARAMQEANDGRLEGAEKQPLPKFVLRLKHEKENKMVRIEIENNGPSIDETSRKRIFEPFFTTKEDGKSLGLGLSVSYFIITKNHGGTLEVVSEPGQGVNFIIRLPIREQR